MNNTIYNMLELSDYLEFGLHSGNSGLAESLEGLLAGLENLLNLPSEQIFSQLFPGLSGLANWHPLLVHFPIAFLTMFVLLELSASVFRKPAWQSIASGLLYLGCFFAGITMIAGLSAAATVSHNEAVHEIMENHEHLGILVFSSSLLLSLWRYNSGNHSYGLSHKLFLVFSLLLSLLVIFTADLGGLMVYGYGVAVKPALENNLTQTSHHHND